MNFRGRFPGSLGERQVGGVQVQTNDQRNADDSDRQARQRRRVQVLAIAQGGDDHDPDQRHR